MRVLVTGGSGYLGGAIVRTLARQGHQPIIFARSASRSSLPGLAVDGDVRDRLAITRAADGADAIIHAAAVVSLWDRQPSIFDEINVGGLEAVLEVARALGLPRLVYTSSFLALPPADGQICLSANDYQRSKERAREVALAAARSGMPIVTLIPGVVYGPGAATEGNLVGHMISEHLSRRLPGLIGADRRWSYAYIDDVAEAHVNALTAGTAGQEYPLGGENATQMRAFEIVQEKTGAGLPRRIPFPLAVAAGWVEEQRTRLTGHKPILTRGAVEIFRHDWSLDSRRSVVELNYRITLLETGITRLLGARA